MLLSLKWIDNLQYIERHQRICHLFFIFKLTCCKFIDLKENTLNHSFQNHYSKKIKHPHQGFSYEKIRMSNQWREFGGSPCKPKNLIFAVYHPHQKIESPCPLITDHILEKKVTLIAFRQILSKLLPEACILSNTMMTYLKKLVGTKSHNTKQCSARLSPRILPHYPPKHLWETPWMRKISTQQPKIYSFPPTEKSPLEIYFFDYQKCHFFPIK